MQMDIVLSQIRFIDGSDSPGSSGLNGAVITMAVSPQLV